MMHSVKLQEILNDIKNECHSFDELRAGSGGSNNQKRHPGGSCATDRIQCSCDIANLEICGFASLEKAGPTDISFWTGNVKSITGANGFSAADLAECEAGVLFVPESLCGSSQGTAQDLRKIFPKVRCLVPVENPYHAMVCFLEKYGSRLVDMPRDASGAPVAQIDPSAEIGPGCVVMPGARIGARCRLEANVVIYPNVVVGEGCIFQAGVVVGSRGFGFYEYQGKRRMVPHLAGVRIGNNCSFGANTVVAAGFISPTTIGNDCHFDAMVQIGHNCVLGNNIYMAAQTALGGTTIVEDDVNIAGGAKAAGHLTIGRGAIVTAKAGVTKSVPPGRTVAGFPAIDADVWRRQMVELRMMAKKHLKK